MTSQPDLQTIQYTYCPISHNEIWSINKIQEDKHFSSKIMHKMRQGD